MLRYPALLSYLRLFRHQPSQSLDHHIKLCMSHKSTFGDRTHHPIASYLSIVKISMLANSIGIRILSCFSDTVQYSPISRILLIPEEHHSLLGFLRFHQTGNYLSRITHSLSVHLMLLLPFHLLSFLDFSVTLKSLSSRSFAFPPLTDTILSFSETYCSVISPTTN